MGENIENASMLASPKIATSAMMTIAVNAVMTIKPDGDRPSRNASRNASPTRPRTSPDARPAQGIQRVLTRR